MNLLNEFRRKFIHFLTIFIPIFYCTETSSKRILILLLFILFFVFLFEFIRFKNLHLNIKILKIFNGLTRKEERISLAGSTYLLLSSILTIIFYEKIIAITSLLFVIIGDYSAALIGKTFGKNNLFKKTFEGALACFIMCFIIGIFFFNFKIALISSFFATLIEVLPLPINDNLIMPLLTGLIIKICMIF
ncbi:MAG: hypothetical protein ABIB46_02725 [bacterium]